MRRAASSRRWQSVPTVAVGNNLGPGGLWSGTNGSGGTAPAENATALGSGSVLKAIGNFDQAPIGYLTGDLTITVPVDTAETAWIKEVAFYCEGNSITIPASAQTISSATGAIGYSCTLKYSLFPQDGDFQVYAYIRPNNGYERRVGPLNYTVLGTGVSTITRAVRYLDFVNGNDTWDGTSATFVSGTTGPVKTIRQACINWASIGADCVMAGSAGGVLGQPGTYLEDLNTGSTVLNSRPITFRPASGTLGDVIIDRTARYSPEYRWIPRAQNIIFNKIQIETSNVVQIYPADTATMVLLNSKVADTRNGQAGPTRGYYVGVPPGVVGVDFQSDYLRTSGGAFWSLINTAWTHSECNAPAQMIGGTINTGCDGVQIQNAPNGITYLNSTADKRGDVYIRYHNQLSVTVASVAFTGGRTVITWNAYDVGTTLSAGQSDPTLRVRFLTGTLAGTGSEAGGFIYAGGEQPGYSLYAHDAVAFTTTLQSAMGNLTGSISAGDTAWVAGVLHPDMGQISIQAQTHANYDNVIFQRWHATGDFFQPIFLQAGSYTGAGTITTDGAGNGTCSTTHNLQVNDFVFVNAPANGRYRQSRRVIAVPSSTTFTLVSDFSAAVSAVAWTQGKSINNAAYQLCTWNSDYTYGSGGPSASQTQDITQLQHGHGHLVMRQCSHLRTRFTFRTSNAGFGLEGFVIRDSIIEYMDADAVPGWPTTDGVTLPAGAVTIDRNHFNTGTAQGTNSELGVATLDTTLKPTAGVALSMTPKLKWDTYGAALFNDGTDLVGAVKR